MAFWSAKPKYFAVVSNKHHAVARINWTRAEIAFLNSHYSTMKFIIVVLEMKVVIMTRIIHEHSIDR